MRVGRQICNALTAAAETPRPTFVSSTASRTPKSELQQQRWTANQVPEVIQHTAAKKLVYLSRYVTPRERLNDMQFGLESLGIQALLATLDEI
jgi:hypothetical protein